MTAKTVIISTDPGIDDAVAMTIALLAPALKVKLLVPTWGNVSLAKTVNNTLRLEKFLGTTVPVVRGAEQPLVRPAINAADVHGQSGMDGFAFPEADQNLIVPGLAAVKIHEMVQASKGKVSLVQIGPATDFALYFAQYPADRAKIEQLVIMGASLNQGNWGPFGEFNTAADPEAAKMVYQAGVKIYLAPLDLGRQAYIKPAELQQIKQIPQLGPMLFGILTNLQDISRDNGREIYDALAIAMLLAPELFDFQAAHVAVDTNQGPNYGVAGIDFNNYYQKAANAQVGVRIDRERFAAWFLTTLKECEVSLCQA